MKNQLVFMLLSCILTFCVPETGLSEIVKGVNFPDEITIGDDTLSLVGVGVRKKLIINVYLGALYLANPSTDYDTIITSNQAKRIHMHFLYREVSEEQLVEAWREGFEKNSPDAITRLNDSITKFNGWFTESVVKGDTITVTYLPGTGTEVQVKDVVKGVIPGEEFMRAVFAIWFGKYPPSNGLKEGMTGK